ncbi:2,3-bisphosphoglycerate-dependent phosphoglycerate mutase [Gloeobacter morelensis]|uniref:2,3-bisphosphoglycerate-dependent phosphoglycerate mutase n=1 Tax=Gloeobacter morelensis MG652769 TaxID=2781736 RepID=A0ABY3PML8_9CYAN|nr:2,3-diphosphoglycerate-dependent phosphoglycerate mutase [Gloeobacter morelensis]UFP94849.1 2,3-diphosphoglycerate-dependent phosphoglycerate mutase [Gloeobacter morelensis MG652769]
MALLVMVRHGQSIWNLENRFTGWTDVPLTEKGRAEARACGELIYCIPFAVAFTSKLTRAQDTLRLILEAAEQPDVPVVEDQALNERHYGELQGLNKAETAAKYGEETVRRWRRSLEGRPPGGESLKDTAVRSLRYFYERIVPELEAGKNAIVSAHGNTIRAILMELDHLSPEQVEKVEIEYCVPVAFEHREDGTFCQVLMPQCDIIRPPQPPARSIARL